MSARYYASLVGPLLGCYYPLPDELTTREQRGIALNTSRLKSLWCSIYTYEQVMQQLAEFGGMGLFPDEYAKRLDYDSAAVDAVRREEEVRPDPEAERVLHALRTAGPLDREDLRTLAMFASAQRFGATLQGLLAAGEVVAVDGAYSLRTPASGSEVTP